jgi:hypothetical protein
METECGFGHKTIEELNLLAECHICREIKTNHRILKDCGHSFCEEDLTLILNRGSNQCPQCRAPFSGPVSEMLKDYHKNSLCELIQKSVSSIQGGNPTLIPTPTRSDGETCCECARSADKWCQDEGLLFCNTHAEVSHKYGSNKNHVLVDPSKKVVKTMCKLHPKKEVEYFCSQEEAAICIGKSQFSF